MKIKYSFLGYRFHFSYIRCYIVKYRIDLFSLFKAFIGIYSKESGPPDTYKKTIKKSPLN